MIKNQSNITIDGSDNRPILIDITYKENKKHKQYDSQVKPLWYLSEYS